MTNLLQKKCLPCSTGTVPLKGEALPRLLVELKEGWKVVDEHHLEKEYHFKDFLKGLEFTNAIGYLAEEEGHHPDILLSWGKVKITLWTHKIDGLSEADFILAAKCDERFEKK